MTTTQNIETRAAQQGERMIEIRIRFWTNNLAEGKGNVLPKHAWAGGMVIMDRNASHGIVPKEPTPFNSLLELPAVIEKVLIAHGICLHASTKMKKYFTAVE